MKKIILTVLSVQIILISSPVNAQFWTESSNEVNASQLSMADDGSIYYLSNNVNLYKSEDDGNLNSWNQLTGFPAVNGYNLFTNDNNMFLLNYETSTYSGRGVFMSDDGGLSWSQKNDGLEGDTNVVTMFSLSNNVLLIQTFQDANTKNLYRSTNNGDSWDFIQSIDGFLRSVTLTSNDEWLLCASLQFFKSVDNGLNWTEITSTSSSGYYNITELANGNLLLMTHFELLESSDGGNTFTPKTVNGLPDITSLTNIIYPQGQFFDEVIYISFNNGHGVFKSEDDGDNWVNIDFNLPNGNVFPRSLGLSKNGYLFAAVTGSGVFRSDSPVTGSVVNLAQNLDEVGSLRIFPNPTAELITISFDKSISNFNVEVRDLQGKLIASEFSNENTKTEINIDGDSGIYLVRVYNENFSHIEKVVKK